MVLLRTIDSFTYVLRMTFLSTRITAVLYAKAPPRHSPPTKPTPM